MKPYKGKIYNWKKRSFNKAAAALFYPDEDLGIGYVIDGFKTKHPHLDTAWSTSWVVKHLPSGWIETRNSRYKLVGKEILS